jgi:hypothetical protein
MLAWLPQTRPSQREHVRKWAVSWPSRTTVFWGSTTFWTAGCLALLWTQPHLEPRISFNSCDPGPRSVGRGYTIWSCPLVLLESTQDQLMNTLLDHQGLQSNYSNPLPKLVKQRGRSASSTPVSTDRKAQAKDSSSTLIGQSPGLQSSGFSRDHPPVLSGV